MSERVILVLGAGASRGVSYARKASIPSPLDRDYFDLLQRFEHSTKDDGAVSAVLQWAQELPFEYWRSMEQCFYTLQSRSYLARKLSVHGSFPTDAEVITAFVNATGALLRAAHGMQSCSHHAALLEKLTKRDAVCTFNYDLVPERALKTVAQAGSVDFGPWVYGWKLDTAPPGWNAPALLKLHGSFSWDVPTPGDKYFPIAIESWDDLEDYPRYRRFKTESTRFPIFLPFWDKRVEEAPWRTVWRSALNRITKCTNLIVWGYSLPRTDLKAYQLFVLARPNLTNLCVIDPNTETRDKWRKIFLKARFFEYSSADAFLKSPPDWWQAITP